MGPVPRDFGRTLGLAGVMGALLLLCAFAAPALASGPAWQSTVSLSATGEDAQTPVVAMDGEGNSEAVWTRSNGTTPIVQSSFRPGSAGAAFSEQDVSSGPDQASAPDVSEDGLGNAEAVWLENGTVYWSWSTNDGIGFGPLGGSTIGTTASPDSCAGNESDPKVAVDSNGNVNVVYLCDSGGTEEVEAAYAAGGTAGALNTSASSSSNPDNLPPAPISTSNGDSTSDVQLAEDPQGDAIAVWDQSNGTHDEVWYSYRPEGNTSSWTTAAYVDEDSSDAEQSPTVAMNGNGGASVAYLDDGDLDEVDASSTALGGGDAFDGTLTTLSSTGTQSNPQIAADDDGDTAVTWIAGADVDADVRPSSGPSAGSFAGVADLGSVDGSTQPQIALTSDDDAIAVWQSGDTIQAETANSSGTFTGTATQISGSNATEPTLAVDDDGDAIAGWLQLISGSEIAVADGYDGGGGPSNNNLHIPATGSAGSGLTLYTQPNDVWPAINSVVWKVDGTQVGTGDNITWVPQSGTHTVSVTSTNADGNSTTSNQTVDIAASAPTVPAGGLTQLGSPNDCVTSDAIGCGTTSTGVLDTTYQQVVSPDDKNVYVASLSGGITEFSRNTTTGALTYIGCITAASSGCTTNNAEGLSGTAELAISPDGDYVYAITQYDNSITGFSRNASTGVLTEIDGDCYSESGAAGCTSDSSLNNPYGIAMSPDGTSIYVSTYNGRAIAEFSRNTSTGDIAPIAGNTCIGDSPDPSGCPVSTSDDSMLDLVGVVVSPDGKNVYGLAGGTSSAGDIVELARNTTTGALSTITPDDTSCIGSASGSTGCTTGASDINGTEVMTFSPNGEFAYANSFFNDAVVEFSRNTSTGALTQLGCVGTSNSPSGLCSTSNDVGIDSPLGIAVSPDGDNVYVSGTGDGAVAAFSVDQTTGLLTQLAAPYNCITSNSSGCGTTDATALGAPRRLVVSPDGMSVYVAGQGADAIIELARAPRSSTTTTTSPTPRSKVTAGTEASWDSDDTATAASATVTATAVNCSANPAGTITGQEDGVRLLGSVIEGGQTYYPYAGIELLSYCDGKAPKYTTEFVLNHTGDDTMTFQPTGLSISPGDPLEMSVAPGQNLQITDVNTGKSASASGAAFSAVNGFDIGISAITGDGRGAPLLTGSEPDDSPNAVLPGPVQSSPTVFSDVDIDGAPLSRAAGLYAIDWVNSSKSTVASPSSIADTNSFSGDIASVPSPTTAKSVDVAPVSGKVLVKLPGAHKFVPLTSIKKIPLGTLINATKGSVQITVELPNGTTQTGVFFDGEFQLEQTKNGATTAVLAGGSFKGCPTPPSKKKKQGKSKKHGPFAQTAKASKKRPVRRLWSNAHGSFSTKGRYGAAAVSGTEWLTQDQCDGTYFKVTRDQVEVTSFDLHNRTTIVKQGHSYLAPAPGYK